MAAGSNNALIVQRLAQITPVRQRVGSFIGRSDSRVTVQLGDARLVLPFVGHQLPPVGWAVQLELRDGDWVVLGPAAPLPNVGSITATGNPRATITAWGKTYTLPYRAWYTPAVGQTVNITWGPDGGVIEGAASTAVVAVTPEPPPTQPPTVFHPPPFTARDSGSYRNGWAQNDVYASDSFISAYFYGPTVKDTIPDNARVLGARINLPVRQTQGADPILALHTSASKPGGPVTFTQQIALTGSRSGWVDFPTGWVDYLKANDGGLGFNHGGYTIYAGTARDQQAGALDLTWEA